jgi:hypothetical protein
VCSFSVALSLAIAAALATGSVHGADATRAACVDQAPWVLAEPADVVAEEVADTPTLDVATYNLHSGLGLRHAFSIVGVRTSSGTCAPSRARSRPRRVTPSAPTSSA